ncbi:MAG: hypothetical protein CMO81_04985 [Waddliaceae bacterium]|nr:hypothetical protein [Waddliaceae bacterium]
MEDDDAAILDDYAGGEIKEFANTKLPSFLKISYFFIALWGFVWLYMFWDGSFGWVDRGYWKELEQVANTTKSYREEFSNKKQTPEAPHHEFNQNN